jgi:hypothetical protein
MAPVGAPELADQGGDEVPDREEDRDCHQCHGEDLVEAAAMRESTATTYCLLLEYARCGHHDCPEAIRLEAVRGRYRVGCQARHLDFPRSAFNKLARTFAVQVELARG